MSAVDFNPMLASSGLSEWLIVTAVVLFFWACVYSPEILKKFQSDKEGRVVSFFRLADRPILWLAQGFGIGRIPFAPGTWGSVLGILLTASMFLLEAPEYVAMTMCLTILAVPVAHHAARLIGEADPASVVIDEIVAVPWCFFPLLLTHNHLWDVPKGILAEVFQVGMLAIGFLLFRLFDIWKPWPIRQSQRLPGGWGIVIDDVLAAVYVNLVMLIAMFALR